MSDYPILDGIKDSKDFKEKRRAAMRDELEPFKIKVGMDKASVVVEAIPQPNFRNLQSITCRVTNFGCLATITEDTVHPGEFWITLLTPSKSEMAEA